MATNQVVAITGVSGGLGFAMTKWFSAQGHIVIGCARSTEKVHQMNHTYCKGKPKQFYVVDITDDLGVQEWAREAISAHGAPHFVLNNAGYTNRDAPLWEISAKEFDKVVDVNLKGSANVIRSFLPDMIKAGRGVVVNFSSGYGRMGAPNVAPYCATKWGIEGLSKALAMELPSPLACVSLDPGMIDTPMLQGHLGGGASIHQTAEQWAQRACSYILSVTRKANGKSLSVA